MCVCVYIVCLVSACLGIRDFSQGGLGRVVFQVFVCLVRYVYGSGYRMLRKFPSVCVFC